MLATAKNFAPVVANYLGIALAGQLLGVLSPGSKKGGALIHGVVAKQAALHTIGTILSTLGCALAGSSLYQVCYSASPIFVTILSILLLGKSVSLGKWWRM